MVNDPVTWIFVAGVLLLLGAATTVGQFLKGQPESGLNPAVVQTFNRRVRVWWLLCSLLAAALFLPRSVTVVPLRAAIILGLAGIYHPDPHPG